MDDFSGRPRHTGLLSEYDLYLIGKGEHWLTYEKLGAQCCTIEGVSGVNFAVWAPNAEEVRVVGDFNGWNPTANYLWKFQEAGIWETFVPEAKPGMLYKFVIRANGEDFEKCDPYAFACECPPKTANKIVDRGVYTWNDADWQARRRDFDWQHRPMSIYEVHLGSWQKDSPEEDSWLNYREIADRLVEYVQKLNFTHIELLPICEHPFSGSWGYQITGYYAPTARFGSPEDFKYMVDKFHQNGIGVILDWVPAHFPKDAKGLGRFDGTALYEHQDPRLGEHIEWGTYVFNYGRNEVRNFLVSNALYWVDQFHVDGLRVDAVASMLYLDYARQPSEWIPNENGGRENTQAIRFLQEMNREVQTRFPGTVTIAEESTAWPNVTKPTEDGGLGFCLKWNMGWMHDTLEYMATDPLFRKFKQDQITFSIMYAYSENFVLPLSHDEVVHCKGSMIGRMPGNADDRFDNLRLMYGYQWTHPGKKLLFMGGEFGQWAEWNDKTQLSWELLKYEKHQGVQRFLADLGKCYTSEPALYESDFEGEGFQWIDCSNRDFSTLTYLRRARDPNDYVVVACNFTPEPRRDFWIGVPEMVEFLEIFNGDSRYYGGRDFRNDAVMAEPEPCQGQPAHISITLPPLAVCIFKPVRK